MKINGTYFYGNKISKYGLENGYVDYGTLSKSFNHILNNDLINLAEFDYYSGAIADEDSDDYYEIFQWYIIDSNGVDILEYWTDEIIYYSTRLNIYLWGVTHYGTSWDYVLTDIECNKE